MLHEVKLGTRYMAERISLPYFYLKMQKNGADFLTPWCRGTRELWS